MDREVKRTEAELNKALAETVECLAELKKQNEIVNCELSNVTQHFEGWCSFRIAIWRKKSFYSLKKNIITSSYILLLCVILQEYHTRYVGNKK